MTKKIVLILFLIIILTAGGFSAFWFFKTSQIEKGLLALTTNKSKVLVGNYKISGFPLKQEIELKNVVINSFEKLLGKGKVTFDKITFSASIFDNKFSSTQINIVNFIDAKNAKNSVEFNATPKITIEFANSSLAKISYSDNGYIVYDKDKNQIASSQNNVINFSVSENQNGQINSRLQINTKQATSLDFVKIYRNNYENGIIDDIKTGKITIQPEEAVAEEVAVDDDSIVKEGDLNSIAANLEDSFQQAVERGEVNLNDEAQNAQAAQEEAKSSASESSTQDQPADDNSVNDLPLADEAPEKLTNDEKEEEEVAPPSTFDPEQDADSTNEAGEEATPEKIAVTEVSSAQQTVDNNITATKNLESQTKFNITVDIEQILTPSQQDSDQGGSDPTKIAQIAKEYETSYKINKLEISNADFMISFNGTVQDQKDDTNISGFTTVKIEKSQNFVEYVKKSIASIVEGSTDNKIQSFDLSYQDASIKYSYNKLLNNYSEKMQEILGEVAVKNQLSQDDVMVFDVRREKNLDFVVNETPIREIVGKF